jgi:hypothetical protein
MKKWIFLITFSFMASQSTAGKIQDTFGDGLFELTWGMSLEEVKSIYIAVDTKEYGNLTQYIVEHEKPVLKVEREGTDLTFSFNPDNQLSGVIVGFDGDQFGDVMNAASSYLGAYQNTPNNTATRIDWPIDAGLKFYLINMPNGFSTKTMLVIENTNRLSDPSKKELGF